MSWTAVVVALLLSVLLYAICVLGLVAYGNREAAGELVRFVPCCAVLFARLAREPRLPRRHKALLVVTGAYLAMPFDVVPDFIPIAGQLDDALVVGLALRVVVRRAGHDVLAQHWPGTASSLGFIERLAGRPS